jgi:RNA polymerase sigma-70 factor (ECF subfamily)
MSQADEASVARQLAARAATDPEAFGALYDMYVDRVYAFSHRMLGSRQEAEDATSDTFASALASIGSFKWRAGGFGAWLLRIARNRCYDALRRRSRSASLAEAETPEPVSPEPGPEQTVLDAETLHRLRVLVGELPERQREAVLLKYAAGLSNEAIGAATGRSATAVSSLIHRVTGKLRERLGEPHGRRQRTAP